MKHLISLLVKFLIAGTILFLVIDSELSFGSVLLMSAAITALTYAIGDLFIFKYSNRAVTTIANFAVSLILLSILNSVLFNDELSVYHKLFTAAALGVGEMIYRFAIRALHSGRREEQDKT